MNEYALTELDRRLANMIRIGAVKEVDTDAARAKVEIGDIVTEWLPWSVKRAGENKTWWAPDIGEQVIVFSPGGDLGQGVIGPSIFQDDFPPNGDDVNVHRTTFKDGSFIEYDREEHALNLTLNNDATLKITIGGMTIEVTKDLAKLGENANNFVALANLVLDEISKVYNALKTATYLNTAGAPTTLVIVNPYIQGSVAATKVKAE